MGTSYEEWRGTAAQDLPKNSVVLEIQIQDMIPAAIGSLGTKTDQYTTETRNADGVVSYSKVTTAKTIKATYEGRPNVKYPPQISKGTQVKVYSYGNGMYYWNVIGRDSSIQKPEIYRMEVSNVPSGEGVKDDTNTYSCTLDTVNGMVQIRTSKSNGEVAAYQFTIDAKAGTVSLSDDKKNGIIMDSNNNTIGLFNNTGASLVLDGNGNITIEAGRDGSVNLRGKTVNANGKRLDR